MSAKSLAGAQALPELAGPPVSNSPIRAACRSVSRAPPVKRPTSDRPDAYVHTEVGRPDTVWRVLAGRLDDMLAEMRGSFFHSSVHPLATSAGGLCWRVFVADPGGEGIPPRPHSQGTL